MVFQNGKKSYSFIIPMIILTILVSFFILSFQKMESTNFEKSCIILADSVRNMSVQCYAIEGQYPQNLSYLEENYGLSYNEKRIKVHYELIGSNLMPDVFVTESEEAYAQG